MIIGILHRDLDGFIGGGQTFFLNLIKKNRSATYIFPTTQSEPREKENAKAVPLGTKWRDQGTAALDLSKVKVGRRGKSLKGREHEILEFFDMVDSFKPHRLDILEIPDYMPYAAFVPAICGYLGLEVGKFVLSMHGTLSAVLGTNWVPFTGDLDQLKFYEDLLYRVCDVRYGIGPDFINSTARRLKLPSQLADALALFEFPAVDHQNHSSSNNKTKLLPSIAFIGRQEKCKGPDIFVDLLSKLDQDIYKAASVIGPAVELGTTNSEQILKLMSRKRHLNINFEVVKRSALLDAFQNDRLIAIFPSRIDTFNLAALEALMNGCPCAISNNCGIINYLNYAYPGIPYLKLTGHAAKDRMNISIFIKNYEFERKNLRQYLNDTKKNSYGLTIDEIYGVSAQRDSDAVKFLHAVFDQIAGQIDAEQARGSGKVRVDLGDRLAKLTSGPPSPLLSSFQTSDAGVESSFGVLSAETPLPRTEGTASRLISLATRKARKNPLFDEQWYLSQYPDVREAGVDAYTHYRLFGVGEGRRPNRVFDGAWYLSHYADVRIRRVNPLDHYLTHGAAEGRRPNEHFDPDRYRELHPESSASNPVLHYLRSKSAHPAEYARYQRKCLQTDLGLDMLDVSAALARDIDRHDNPTPEAKDSPASIAELVTKLGRHVFSGDRIAAYRFAAKLELERGNEVLCATYRLRSLRLAGRPAPEEADAVALLLEKNGYAREAEVARLLYGGAEPEKVQQYLEEQRERWMLWSGSPPDETIDARTIDAPRISIIVSVYNGMGQIGNFLASLHGLPERDRSAIELVLVDSNSTDGTGAWIKNEIERRTTLPGWLSVAYIRSVERETIQKAWNRGINDARGRYFSFMGVDEFNRPDGYGQLADYLDKHPSVDWVVSDAVVQDVDMQAGYVNDVMRYRRRIDSKHDHLLECCYISYVGCLYRSDIHRRFGYYDETFRAAGDTEFKNRILRDANFQSIDDCIGFFTNYPVERVTESPLAEIEDLRAWYVHRSLGGLMYHFKNAGADEMVSLFKRSLCYKKSYMEMDCTDLELASSLGRLIELRFPEHYERIKKAVSSVNEALDAYRALDNISGDLADASIGGLQAKAGKIRNAVETIVCNYDTFVFYGKIVPLDFRSDNRSHQHNNIWAVKTNAGKPAATLDVRKSEAARTDRPRIKAGAAARPEKKASRKSG